MALPNLKIGTGVEPVSQTLPASLPIDLGPPGGGTPTIPGLEAPVQSSYGLYSLVIEYPPLGSITPYPASGGRGVGGVIA